MVPFFILVYQLGPTVFKNMIFLGISDLVGIVLFVAAGWTKSRMESV